MHSSIPLIGTIIWLLVFGGVAFAMYELIRIDRKILKDKEPPASPKEPSVYEHRAVWVGIIIGTVLLPILLGTFMHGFPFGRAWFVVSFGFLPWLMSATSVFNGGAGIVAVIAFLIYALAIAFFALVFRHNQKSTYITLSIITVLVLMPLFVLGFHITMSSLLGF